MCILVIPVFNSLRVSSPTSHIFKEYLHHLSITALQFLLKTKMSFHISKIIWHNLMQQDCLLSLSYRIMKKNGRRKQYPFLFKVTSSARHINRINIWSIGGDEFHRQMFLYRFLAGGSGMLPCGAQPGLPALKNDDW